MKVRWYVKAYTSIGAVPRGIRPLSTWTCTGVMTPKRNAVMFDNPWNAIEFLATVRHYINSTDSLRDLNYVLRVVATKVHLPLED